MANRKKYTERLFKAERLRKKNFIKKIERKKILAGRKANEKKAKISEQNQMLAST